MTTTERALLKRLEQKQIELFERGLRTRRDARRYVQLIDAQNAIKQRHSVAAPRPKKRNAS